MIDNVSHAVFRMPGTRRVVVYREADGMKPSPADDAVRQLKERDTEVRAHEASHAAGNGILTIGTPRFTYQIGPDGKAYAIGGQVTLATMPARDPQAAEQNAKNLKDAALSVSDPSVQDLAAAASADAMISEARAAAARYRENDLSAEKSPLADTVTPHEFFA
ncbi:MAG: putative metalloprotease CJM1_0395 family protein [Spirochaetota bacterium]